MGIARSLETGMIGGNDLTTEQNVRFELTLALIKQGRATWEVVDEVKKLSELVLLSAPQPQPSGTERKA
jgi:hypothetical protein